MRRFLGLCGLFCAFTTAKAAETQVCSETELRTALESGGTIVFGCDTQIVLSATLQVKTNVVIDGNGREVTVSGGGAVRVFDVAEGVSFTLKGLSVVNGLHKGADGASTVDGATPGEVGRGGALAATNATIRIESCVFSNNVAQGGAAVIGSAPFMQLEAPGGEAFGGAIFSKSSDLEIIESEFRTNRAEPGGYVTRGERWPVVDSAGGAIFAQGGTVRLEQSSVEGNQSVGAGGAVALIEAAFEANGCEFQKNWVRARRSDRFGPAPHGDGKGGALYLINSEALIALSRFSENSLSGGGGYDFAGGVLNGGAVYAEKDLTIESSAFLGNSILGWGNVNPITNSAGGALWVGRTAQISESRFANNSVIAPNASVNNAFRHGTPGDAFGGGIFAGGSLHIANSSCISNLVAGGVVSAFGEIKLPAGIASGGGIYASNVLMTNLTLAFNEAVRWLQTSNSGGGLYLEGSSAGTSENLISFCTFATNWSTSLAVNGTRSVSFSQLEIESGSTASMRGSIFSGGTNETVVGTILDEGNNISSGSPFTQATSKNATDAKLGGIGIYGGTTETLPLLPGSPAMNAVVGSDFPATDQRGRARPFGSAADIGAYEVSAPFFVKGSIRQGVTFGEVAVTASGENLTMNDSSGEFSGFFTTSGPLRPVMNGVVFVPEEISLASGVEVFDAWFVGYMENEVAVEPDNDGGGVTVTFAAETAGQYILQSSSDLSNWDDIETRTIAAHGLFQTEVSATGSILFYRVKRL